MKKLADLLVDRLRTAEVAEIGDVIEEQQRGSGHAIGESRPPWEAAFSVYTHSFIPAARDTAGGADDCQRA
jgi:hypothetical protein